jgi:hypothetical protein
VPGETVVPPSGVTAGGVSEAPTVSMESTSVTSDTDTAAPALTTTLNEGTKIAESVYYF